MNMPTRIAAVAAALCVGVGAAYGQQVEWTQTLNLPKGLNLPAGISGDILGIELGETYASAKAKIEAIRNASKNADEDKRITEIKRTFRLPMPNGSSIEASSMGGIRLMINRRNGQPGPAGSETIEVRVSSPSSGHQVIGVKRSITYDNQPDQIRISELVASLKAKFKADPQVFKVASSLWYLFQFNDGGVHTSPGKMNDCTPEAFTEQTSTSVQAINRSGVCDVMLRVEVAIGISGDHAKTIDFWLSDNERAKKNIGADFAFFDSYVRNLQQRPGGAAPKL